MGPAAWFFVPVVAFFVRPAGREFGDSRRLMMPSAHVLMERDPRPPVLYLRSFSSDGSYDQNPRLERLAEKRVLSPAFRRRPHEEAIAEVAMSAGPVIAIGRPGENISEIGAARMYVPHAQWMTAVAHYLATARLVIIRIGDSQELIWDLEAALRIGPLEKAICVLSTCGSFECDSERLAPRKDNNDAASLSVSLFR